MKKKPVTIEDLAVMTQNGFNDVSNRFNDVNNNIAEFKSEVNGRFERIENLLLRAHDNRIEKIEDDIRVLKTTLKLR
ncbi:MAG: hypothetical protein HQK52_03165 [Oligoflexia bacterium]|nr:hypothetical protein [Oligoflexia bacterium]